MEPRDAFTRQRGKDGDEPVGDLDTALDEVIRRLQVSITAGDADKEEQLKGVLRMLGEEIREQDQLSLFGKGQAARQNRASSGGGTRR